MSNEWIIGFELGVIVYSLALMRSVLKDINETLKQIRDKIE